MTYSSTLDETVPGQGEFARLGAGRIRGLTLALKERLASIFVNPDADPLVFKPGLVPDLAQLIKKQSFDYTYAAATVVPAGVAVGTLIASALPAGTPAFVAWKTFPGIPSYSTAAFNFACYFDGTNLHVEAMNNTGSGIDISGASITITAILPYT